MPFSPRSRFAGQPIFTVQTPDGMSRQVVGLRWQPATSAPPARQHRVTQGECIDAIARHHYGGEGVWWQILDANPLVYPLDLEPGDVLAIPGPATATRISRARKF